MEDYFGEVEVGETYSIQWIVDDVIYHLWGVKEPNYVIRTMAASGRLLTDDTSKETVRIWKENGEDLVNNFKYKLPFYWYFVTAMRLMITTTSWVHWYKFRIHGWKIGGSVGYLLSFWTYQRLMHSWFYSIFLLWVTQGGNACANGFSLEVDVVTC